MLLDIVCDVFLCIIFGCNYVVRIYGVFLWHFIEMMVAVDKGIPRFPGASENEVHQYLVALVENRHSFGILIVVEGC